VNACNKFCESILHTACRRSTAEVIRFLLENDADVHVIDDYGRTALHDACWRTEPDFRIVSLLMDQDANLIHLLDSRNFTPLKYIREEHWLDWCRFLYMKKDDYWPLPFKGQLEYPIVWFSPFYSLALWWICLLFWKSNVNIESMLPYQAWIKGC